MLRNEQNHIFIDNNPSSDTSVCLMDDKNDSKAISKASKIQKPAHKLLKKQQETVKVAANEQHTRSRLFSSLHSIFARQRRPSITRSMSRLSIRSCKSITENTFLSSPSSSSSSSITSSTASKESSFSKFVNLFPIKGNSKSTLSLANKPTLLSKKSLEFEALLEEFPSRTIKANLTPCTAA